MGTKEEYRAYLRSEHWRLLRQRVLARDGWKCTRCPATRRLQAHHRFYRERWEDSVSDDLITLCHACHKREHQIPSKVVTPANWWQNKSLKKSKKRRGEFRRKRQRLGWSF